MTFEVEIRVAGAVDPSWVTGEWPGFTADAASLSAICGVLGENEHLSDVLAVLARHGLTPLDVWLDRPAGT